MKIHSRDLKESDYTNMRALLLEAGPNEWNYLTEESIDLEFSLLEKGKAIAVLAEENEITGFAVLIFKESCPVKLERYTRLSHVAYIKNVVVSPTHSGKGLGSQLLLAAVSLAGEEQCSHVYIERHQENAASAGMMRKAGFKEVETFKDPERRSSGSRNTTVLCKCT
jgi:ribosomal protein S18 acetylase RimI-like enzyme